MDDTDLEKLNEDLLDDLVESNMERPDKPERDEKETDTKVPLVWDPQTVDLYRENVESERPEDLKEFEDQKPDALKTAKQKNFEQYSRWEERFLITHHQTLELADLASRLNRSEDEVEAKLASLGILSNMPE